MRKQIKYLYCGTVNVYCLRVTAIFQLVDANKHCIRLGAIGYVGNMHIFDWILSSEEGTARQWHLKRRIAHNN